VGHSGLALTIASRTTREVDGVIDRLRQRGHKVVRFAPCQYPGSFECSWRPGKGTDAFETPQAAWLCDFSGWSVESLLTGLEREVALAETTAFVEGLLLAIDTQWLNRPDAVRSASRKLLQLECANRLDIAVPSTCITNDPVEARKFFDSHAEVVAKALATGFVTYGEVSLKLYTRLIGSGSDALFGALTSGPLILQQRISKVEEIRAVVVDGNVTLVRVNLRGLPDELVDIRTLDYRAERARFVACKDRPDLADASRRIVDELQLSYGCIDWAIEADGAATFLECNPLGAFKWFELCSGEDITGMLADALATRCAR
jgi:glutathione synthase/RimK-type ligase-like ATP-grasp enzyme